MLETTDLRKTMPTVDQLRCHFDGAARIIGQKWTLQIVHTLLDRDSIRFCELQEALGGVNPSTLTSRLKMLEEEGLVRRFQVSDIPPHVEYSLTDMGCQLRCVIEAITGWSATWLCSAETKSIILSTAINENFGSPGTHVVDR